MKKVAVFLGGLVLDSQRKILESIYERMDEAGVDVYTFTCHVLHTNGAKVVEGACQIYRLPDISEFDGVILAPHTIADPKICMHILHEIKQKHVPAVCVGYAEEGIASVIADNYKGMYELVEHLVTVHGKRKIYYLGGSRKNGDARKREQAFLDVMEKHGIPLDPLWFFEGNFAPESGELALDFWMKESGALPEAIVCANDAMAQAIMVKLEMQGVKIPEEVIVTGVDNSRIAIDCEPQLTSVERCYDQMGKEACRLLSLAEEGQDISGTLTELPSTVAFRESCGCKPGKEMDFVQYKEEHMINGFFAQEISVAVRGLLLGFGECNSIKDIVETLKHYVVWTDAQFFYLCMNDIGEDLTRGYSEYMTIPLAYENGRFSQYGPYESRKVLPEEVLRGGKNIHYVMIPLHYQNESFGYCVFGNSNFPLDRELCYSWILTISGAIQSIRRNLQLQETVKKLNKIWCYDQMTGVYNRAGFFSLSKIMLKKAKQDGTSMYVLFMDLDGLKKVNDTYGHEAGDRYICAIAHILKKVSGEDELVMRYGGDEFAVMGEAREYNRAQELEREIETELTRENHCGAYRFPLAVSMGYTEFEPQKHENLDKMIEQVLEQADQEMYKEKRRRREKDKNNT